MSPPRPKSTSPLNPTGKKHKFNKAWMNDHVHDHWVTEAKRLGFRSRAAFKLLEIIDKDKLIRPGMRVVDLGAAPGSWSQVLAQALKGQGRVFAVDLLDFEPIRGVSAIKADFGKDEGLALVEGALDGQSVDLVVSDMAPNITGIDTVDRARGVHLAELALEFAIAWLKPGGDFAVKMFQGEGFDEFQRLTARNFGKTYVRKPKASRDRSREVFVVGKGLKAAVAAPDAALPAPGAVTG
jgi:23S rRNA (uridine2552-2'-O)-methyltransferase